MLMHFKNSKSCAANIDMDHFTDIYGKVKKADRLKNYETYNRGAWVQLIAK